MSINIEPVIIDVSSGTLEAAPQRAVLRINDPYLRVAARALMERGGVEVSELDNGSYPLVTDDPRLQSPRTILIVDETVGAAQVAVQALRDRKLGSIISRHDPRHLLLALMCMDQQMLTVPAFVVDLAAAAPSLAPRQYRILAMIAEGMSNTRIATRLTISEPTVKREISDLFRIFGCSTRLELAIKAAEVGYPNV